eukprot:CAMPEP_0206590008 /NCGR_PEP_ID=MMETSP0325_2-20121206/39310_1 /ASSEMBLY_ACC=CAM_ASM_000347 /TAXON_ID=2866 /ORGANISM="Crypthecodinium cohnii, Strain Seligo" /LENGTH=154 /DNA_ID=CAMNT_0054098771 /DNA_START=26 /DNA_END=490 /DNA_ORIENTATION=+
MANPEETPNPRVWLTNELLNLDEAVKRVTAPDCGAIATFLGTTRNYFEGKEVVKLEYEAYEPMAIKSLEALIDELYKKPEFADVKHVVCGHRLGVVPVCEASVVIAVSSGHRAASFHACHWLLDELKAKVPIWKKEIYTDGSTWKANKEWDAPA